MDTLQDGLLRAVIFDLDGVLVSTDESHYQAWKKVADEEGIPFDRRVNERLRGVSRMESLEIVLERAPRAYTAAEKQTLARRKNRYYQQLIAALTPQAILPGALAFVDALCGKKLKTAVASSSKNAPFILERLRLADTFDAVVSGNDIAKSKPDPEVFLTAARRLETAPAVCLVVEDSLAGIEAAKAGGMRALGVGFAARSPLADFHAESLATASVDSLLRGLPA